MLERPDTSGPGPVRSEEATAGGESSVVTLSTLPSASHPSVDQPTSQAATPPSSPQLPVGASVSLRGSPPLATPFPCPAGAVSIRGDRHSTSAQDAMTAQQRTSRAPAAEDGRRSFSTITRGRLPARMLQPARAAANYRDFLAGLTD